MGVFVHVSVAVPGVVVFSAYHPEVKIRRAFDRLKEFLDMAGQDIFGNLRQQNAILGEQFASLLERTVGGGPVWIVGRDALQQIA